MDEHGAAKSLYARQWCRVPDDALQEALIDLARQDPVPDNPVAWLYKTVRRRAMNLAINQQEILDALLNGEGEILNYPFSVRWPTQNSTLVPD